MTATAATERPQAATAQRCGQVKEVHIMAKVKAAVPEIKVPKRLPEIPGMTRKAVENLYRAERLGPAKDGNGLGHVRVMARLTKRARGQEVPAIGALRRYTEPITAKA